MMNCRRIFMNNHNTHKPGRLPRYKRAAGDVSLVLTARDLEILRLVQSFRLLTSEQIQALTQGSGQNILRRLQKLFHSGYLDRLSPRLTPNGGSAKMIYAITNRGIATLQKEGVLKEVRATDLNAQNRGLHDFSIHHRLLISHIRATFMLACQGTATAFRQNAFRASTSHATISSDCQVNQNQDQDQNQNQDSSNPDLELLLWREGREIYDTIEVALPAKYAQLPVAPDAFFTLRDA